MDSRNSMKRQMWNESRKNPVAKNRSEFELMAIFSFKSIVFSDKQQIG
jgi:hypothetical protein